MKADMKADMKATAYVPRLRDEFAAMVRGLGWRTSANGELWAATTPHMIVFLPVRDIPAIKAGEPFLLDWTRHQRRRPGLWLTRRGIARADTTAMPWIESVGSLTAWLAQVSGVPFETAQQQLSYLVPGQALSVGPEP